MSRSANRTHLASTLILGIATACAPKPVASVDPSPPVRSDPEDRSPPPTAAAKPEPSRAPIAPPSEPSEPTLAPGDPASLTALAVRARWGGAAWERGPKGCIQWFFAPKKNRLTRRETTAGRTEVTMYDYELETKRLERGGPRRTFFIENGRRREGARGRCIDYDDIAAGDGSFVLVRDARWYFKRSACEAAPAPETTGDRGC
ncbi:MAG: hypothetical protein AAF721_15635 [Myxococcota bacterium]